MAKWWWSEFFTDDRAHGSTGGKDADLGMPPAIALDLDELIAMRSRHPILGHHRRIDGFRFGDLVSRRRGIGLELDNIGPYQWGDDIRHMDWFATARIGRPQVKQFRHDVQQTVILALDLRPQMMFGSKDQLMAKTACLAAAKIAWLTSKDHQPLGLLIIGGGDKAELYPPRRGRRARLQYLTRIVDAYQHALKHRSTTSTPLADKLEGLPARMSGDVEAVIISDFSQLGDDFDQRLRETGAKGTQSAIVIEDSLMSAPPPSGLYPLRSEQDRQLATVAIRRSDTNLYRRQAERHRRDLRARLLHLGMRQVMIADAQSINEGYFK